MPSIMTGINQTKLMSVSIVVIASLIGAEGLGALILQALQYVATGPGLLSDLTILFCVMVFNRIAQGRYRKSLRVLSKPVAGHSRAAAWLHQSLMLIKALRREVG